LAIEIWILAVCHSVAKYERIRTLRPSMWAMALPVGVRCASTQVLSALSAWPGSCFHAGGGASVGESLPLGDADADRESAGAAAESVASSLPQALTPASKASDADRTGLAEARNPRND
jgi:hypothetical protein